MSLRSLAFLEMAIKAAGFANFAHGVSETLHDAAYNQDRHIETGNPYKGIAADLIKRGVKIELCGATTKLHSYGNEDLLPNIKINTDAMSRTIQLVQEGIVKISES